MGEETFFEVFQPGCIVVVRTLRLEDEEDCTVMPSFEEMARVFEWESSKALV